MVCKTSTIKNIVNSFVKELSQRKIDVNRVILFGSYAYGKPKGGSDIDLAVISRNFRKMDDIKRIMILSDAARHIETPGFIDINPIGFTEEELQKADYFEIGGEIVEKGVTVYSSR